MCLLYLFLIKIPMLGWQEQHIHYYGRLAFAYSLNHTLIRGQRMKSNTKKLFQRTICFGNASIFFLFEYSAFALRFFIFVDHGWWQSLIALSALDEWNVKRR